MAATQSAPYIPSVNSKVLRRSPISGVKLNLFHLARAGGTAAADSAVFVDKIAQKNQVGGVVVYFYLDVSYGHFVG